MTVIDVNVMKKKFFILILAALCCFSMNAQNVGDEFEISYYGKFRITSINPDEVEMVEVDNGIGSGGDTFNTAEWNNTTYKITSLKTNAFKGYPNSNSIFRFENLTSFESDAFYEATCHSINMTNSPLTELPKSAFERCYCKNINLPNSITTISEKAFQWSDIEEIDLQNLTRIEGAAFFESSIKSIKLSNVTYIGGSAFYGCSNLSSIQLPNVTYIGGSAFEECKFLSDIALPQCLETVKGRAFEDCFLSSLSLYNTVKTFENSGDIMLGDGIVTMNIVDWGNKNVLANFTGFSQAITYKYNDETITGEYTLPDNVTSLGEGALYHCTDITVINMPESLTQIGAKALAKCANLSGIRCNATTAPAVVNANAFSEVDKSINVIIPDKAESYYSYIHTTGWKDFTNYNVSLTTIQGAAIIELYHTAGYNPSQAVKDIIADYISKINDATDKTEVEALTQAGVEVIIAQTRNDRGMVKIGNLYYILDSENHTATVTYGGLEADGYATAEYTGSINIPESVTYNDAAYSVTAIGEHAFQNCNGLTDINISMKVTRIDDDAFNSCKGLKTVLLPTLLNSIGNKAFFGCSAITSINCLALTPCNLGTYSFEGVSKSIPVTVLESCLETYRQESWGGFTNFVTNPTLDTAKTNAKSAITEALGSYESVNYIGNLALNFCLHIDAATTFDQVEALGTEGLYAVTYSISTYQELFGEMGKECDDCPAVEVTKGTKTIKLYAPDKVNFIKATNK